MNIGQTVNDYMQVTKSGDWAIFVDHDVLSACDNRWFLQVYEIIEKHGHEYSLFTAMTNRYGGKLPAPHIYEEMFHEHNIKNHYKFACQKAEEWWGGVHRWPGPFDYVGGNFYAISHDAWKAIGGLKEGFFGVDTCLFHDCSKLKGVGLMKGVYVYHKYRADEKVDHCREAYKLFKNVFNGKDVSNRIPKVKEQRHRYFNGGIAS
jgi:hypothetical protein